MVRGSLDQKAELLLEEFNLKAPHAANHLTDRDKPSSPQKDEGQKGTDEPWKLPGQSSQQPEQTPPPKPDYDKRKV